MVSSEHPDDTNYRFIARPCQHRRIVRAFVFPGMPIFFLLILLIGQAKMNAYMIVLPLITLMSLGIYIVDREIMGATVEQYSILLSDACLKIEHRSSQQMLSIQTVDIIKTIADRFHSVYLHIDDPDGVYQASFQGTPFGPMCLQRELVHIFPWMISNRSQELTTALEVILEAKNRERNAPHEQTNRDS